VVEGCPLPVAGVVAQGLDHGIAVAWQVDAEGAERTEFWVQVGERIERTDATSLTVLGLRNGQEYEVIVYAATDEGRSVGSEPVRATPLNGAEGEVAGLIVDFVDGVADAPGTQEVAGEQSVNIDMEIGAQVSDSAVLVELDEPVSIDEAERIASQLEADPRVEWAEPDQFLFTANADSSGWNLSGAYGVDAPVDPNAGEGATVAVIDTGVTEHPELSGSLVSGYDFVSSPEQLLASRQPNAPPVAFDGDYVDEAVFGATGRDANPADPGDWREAAPTRSSSWHGTQVAGVIASIVPGASIQPIRALSWRGGLLSDIAASITWASGGEVDGVPSNVTPSKVINMSFATETTCPTALQDAIDGARERGSILIAAAGNANDDAAKYAPGNCAGVITVGATSSAGTRAPYSNHGMTVDLSAPGGDNGELVPVISNTGGTDPGAPGSSTAFGTSIAAAHVSAGAAMLAGATPTLTPDDAFRTLTGRDYVKEFASPTCDTNPDYSCGTGILSLAQIASLASGDQDYAMSFNGSSQYAYADGSQSAFQITGSITIEAWVKPTAQCPSDGVVLRKYFDYGIWCGGTGWFYILGTAGSTPVTQFTGQHMTIGEWQHIALTRAAGQDVVKFYINGKLASTGSTGGAGTGPIRTSNDDVEISSYIKQYAFFPGEMDEIRLFNTERTAAEVAADMHTYGPVDTSGLVAYYDFNEGPAGTSGPGTVYNRAAGATSATNLRTVNGPTYTTVATTSEAASSTMVTFPRSYLTAAGGWRVPSTVSTAGVVIVGGGGSGGAGRGGGGGAGAFYDSVATPMTPGTVMPVVVGQGGIARRGTSPGVNGQSSSFASITMTGGGAGGGFNTDTAAAGGSGGGGAGGDATQPGAAAAGSGVSKAGGSSIPRGGGGGGGAGSVGGNAVLNATAGNGGSAVTSAVTGLRYAGGGGGGGHSDGNTTPGSGGDGIGGAGCASVNCWATSGAANTGSGGGGAGDAGNTDPSSYNARSGGGGAGVVVVRYDSTPTPTGTCAPVETTVGTTRYVAFKSTGSCSWVVPSGVTSLNYVLVGGGGSGAAPGGAGGAGGMIEPASSASVTSGGAVTVTVGGGAAGASQSGGAEGGAGGFSSIQGAGLTQTWAWGGGKGSQGIGGNGGSGGAGPSGLGQGTAGQGNGSSYSAGGGAGSAGSGLSGGAARASNLLSPSVAQALGVGVVSGGSVFFAGGGGGWNSGGSGGSGGLGGGTGGSGLNGVGSAGSAATGGGGGGGGYFPGASGSGGSGVVVFSYSLACTQSSYTSSTYTVVEFAGAGTCSWTPPSGVSRIDYLLVGGGGGGGADGGGGGGGGGLRYASSVDVSVDQDGLAIAVGSGGRAGTFSGVTPAAGTSSTLTIGSTSNTATGGGAGGTGPLSANGGAGGSGTASGGAGGAGARGLGTVGTAGAPGSASDITGATIVYGGGGGGGVYAASGGAMFGPIPGGNGGGGSGAGGIDTQLRATAGDGLDGLGGGGGGGFAASGVSAAQKDAAAGGDGVVIIRYVNRPDAPTSPSATAGQESASVSWAAPSYTGGSAITEYTVTAVEDDTKTCTATAPAVTCTVSDLTAGTSYTFTVVAENANGDGAASSATTAVIPFGPLNHFDVTATNGSAVGNQTAGTSFNIKITAQDSGNRTVTSFDGSVDLTTASLFSSSTSTTTGDFTNGVLSTYAITLTRAGASQTITATETGGTVDGESAAFTVSAGSVERLQVLLPGESAAPGTASGRTGSPSGVTAGNAVTATVNAVDANWNVVSSVTPTVAITSSDASAVLPSNAALVSGTGTFSVTLKTAGGQDVTATSSPLTAGTSADVTVGAATPSQLVVSTIGQQTAGSAFSVTVTLADTYGNAANNTGADGTVTLSKATGNGTLGGTLTGTMAVNSSAVTISGVTYSKAESGVSLSATGSGTGSAVLSKTGTSNTFAVIAGSLAKYSVTLSSTTPVAGGTVTVTAQAQDANGNDVAANGRTINWSASGTGGSFASATSTTNASGVATVVYTVPTTAGVSRTVTATDAANSSYTGTSASLTTQVGGASAAQSTLTASSASSASVTADGTSTVTLTVQAKDANGNNLTTGGSTVVVTQSSGSATLSSVTDNSNGTYTATVTAPTTTGSSVFVATLGGSAVQGGTGSQQQVTVSYTPGAATKIVVSTAPVAGASGAALSSQPVVRIADANNNTVTTDSSTQVTVTASGGTLSGTTTVTASSGVVTFTGLTFAGLTTTSYTLTFASGSLASATSSITPLTFGTATRLSITTPAADTTYGTAFPTQPVVTALDSAGNTVTSWSTLVTATVTNASSTSVGTATATPSSGLATFSGFGGTIPAGTMTITYSSGALTAAVETVVVSQKGVVVTASSPSVTYGDPVPTITPSYAGFENGQSASVLTTAPTCTTTYTPTSSAGTTQSTSCSGAVAANYSFTYTPGAVTIGQATPTFTWAPVTKTYGDGTYSIIAPTASTAGTFTYASSNTAVLTVSGSNATVVAPGTSTVTATFTPTDTTNFVSGGTTTSLVTVNKATQAALTITTTSGTYGTALTLATSGGTTAGSVTYAVTDGTATGCTVTGASLSVTGAGTCLVTATMAGNSNYFDVSSSATTVTFARAAQAALTVTTTSGTYGSLLYLATSGGTTAGSVTYAAVDGTATGCAISGGALSVSTAGTCLVTATMSGNTDYLDVSSSATTVTFARASQTAVTITSANTALFGETITLAASGGSGTGALSFTAADGTAIGCSVSGTTLSYTTAGTCLITARRASDTNYLQSADATQTLTIQKAGQTVAFTSTVPTQPEALQTYTPTASAISTVTGSTSGVTHTFGASGSCSLSGGVVTFNAGGLCTITANAAGTDNYTAASQVTQVIDVGRTNQNITFMQPANVSFGSADVAMVASSTSGLAVTFARGAGTTNSACTVSSLGVVTINAVGTCEVVASQAGNATYAAASQVTRAFQVLVALPGAPTLRSASASSQAITVGFSTPGFDGGESISAYRVVATPVGSGPSVTSTSCTASPCTISGLTNGTAYTVTVAAINSAGTGTASGPSTALTPATAAYAVGGLAATPGDTTVTLTWTALTSAQLGGGTFDHYRISMRPAGTSTWNLVSTALTSQSADNITIPGLNNGTSYDFQVVAITSANQSTIAGNTAEVVQYPSTVPSEPQSPTVLAYDPTSVQFSWAAPLSDGGSALDATAPYTVTVTGSAGATPVTCVPTGVATNCIPNAALTNGAVYTFSVVATNRMGNSVAATATYYVPSDDATLSDLEVTGTTGAVALTPAFDSLTTEYTATVVNGVATVTVTPTARMAGSTIEVDGVVVVSGSASASLPLQVGENEIEVLVTASDPRYDETYTVTITRAPPSGGGSGGGASPNPGIPVVPPASVSGAGVPGAVMENGVLRTDVVLVRTPGGSGWEAMATDFMLTVEAESASGVPEPLAPGGAMQAPQGGRIVLNGDGFEASSEVAVFAIPRTSVRAVAKAALPSVENAVYLGSTPVSAQGVIDGTLIVPATMPVGDYVLQVNGVTTSQQLRSVNLLLDVMPAPVVRTGSLRQAAFFEGGSDRFSTSGVGKLRAMVESIPKGAEDVQVTVVGVSTALDTPRANLNLARDRAQSIVDYLQEAGVKGTFTVSVSTTFDVRTGDKAADSLAMDKPMTSSSGKPLTTVGIAFTDLGP
jgi:outer membrane protein OmpA-like peptidoglycan-associated protein